MDRYSSKFTNHRDALYPVGSTASQRNRKFMKLSSGFQKFWWTVLAGLLLIGAILIGKTVLAKPAIISADAAVNLALSYGNSNIYLEWDNRPSGIFGKVMKCGEAVQYKTTQPIPPQENIARMSDVPVWLILLQGNFVEHVPEAPGSPGIPEKEIHHNQIALIIYGVSGDIIETFWVSPQEALSMISLPALTPPSGTVSPTPLQGPIHTAVPLPTTGPASPIP